MTVEEIERLLAEFYEGNTNEQEEELLKEAFRTEEVPEHLQKDKKLFLSFFPSFLSGTLIIQSLSWIIM